MAETTSECECRHVVVRVSYRKAWWDPRRYYAMMGQYRDGAEETAVHLERQRRRGVRIEVVR